MDTAPEVLPAEDALENFFAPAPYDRIDSLLSQYQTELAQVQALAKAMQNPAAVQALPYFVEGNKPDNRLSISERFLDSLFDLDGAVPQLWAKYWDLALRETDVLEYMPQQRRYEWYEQIRKPRGTPGTRPDRSDAITPLPAFEGGTVRATLSSLLNSRASFFAERIDGLFQALSRTHVTNQPEGFGKRMILSGLLTGPASACWDRCGYIDDLRSVIARFMGRDAPHHGSTIRIMDIIRADNGCWHELDGGALRIRVYNGAGTGHIEVHPAMAWRLNAVLAMLHPQAIPAKHRKRPARHSFGESFELLDTLLPFAVIRVLSDMAPAWESEPTGRNGLHKSIPNTLRMQNGSDLDKGVRVLVEKVMLALGGTWNAAQRYWAFDYDPAAAMSTVICSGAIPDSLSHQFYPTPEAIALDVIEAAAAGAEAGALWLEPSAGTGGLASHVPADAQLHCVEVSSLHAQVLETKGMTKVFCEDFLVYAARCPHRYSRIITNPPYDRKRWQTHLEAAAGLLAPGGRLVAVLPASCKGKTLVPGLEHHFGRTYENAFAGTSMAVVMVVLERQSE